MYEQPISLSLPTKNNTRHLVTTSTIRSGVKTYLVKQELISRSSCHAPPRLAKIVGRFHMGETNKAVDWKETSTLL